MKTPSVFGNLLRHHRRLRGLSQLALAEQVSTTTRHLSYLENGRSRPGRDIVLRLSDALALPLRGRNELLNAAGLPAEFPESALSSARLLPYDRAVRGLITALDPYPAFVLDSLFFVTEANRSGQRLLSQPQEGQRLNLADALLSPGAAGGIVTNFSEVAWTLRARLSRATVAAPKSVELTALERRMESYLAGVPKPPFDASGEPVICPTFRIAGQVIQTVGMTLRFGASRDVTLEELSVDVLYPRDEAAERFFREFSDS